MILNEFYHDVKLNPVPAVLGIIISAIGFVTTFLTLALFISDFRTDRFYPDHRHIYRLESQLLLPNGVRVRSAQVPLPLIDALKKEPGITSVSYAHRFFTSIRSEGRVMSDVEIFAVSPEFLTRLNPYRQSLAPLEAHEIYITPAFNRRYLGFSSPRGKIIELGNQGKFIIKDVVEPHKDSSQNMPIMIAFSPWMMEGYDDKRRDWYNNQVYAFIHSASPQTFDNRLLDQVVERYAPQLPGAPATPAQSLHFSARNILAMHYGQGFPDELAAVHSMALLHTLYGAAIFVLLTTLVNFLSINGIINAAKRSSLRIKRCIGASDKQILAEYCGIIFPQFLCIMILALGMLLGSALLSEPILALLHQVPCRLQVGVFMSVSLIMGGMIVLSQWIYLHLFVFSVRNTRGDARFESKATYYINKLSMVAQLLLSGSMVYIWAGAIAQNHYVMDTDFGYHKKNLLTFEINEPLRSLAMLRMLQDRLKETTGTSNIALSSWRPFDMSPAVMTVQHGRQQQDQSVAINAFSADRNFPLVWGLETLAGKENAVSESRDPAILHVIVTRAFMNAMGQSSYDEVMNNTFYIDLDGKKKALRVLRIVDNIYLGERTTLPQPLMIFIKDNIEKYGSIKYSTRRQRDNIISQFQDYGLSEGQIVLVDDLHRRHFKNHLLITNVIRLVAALSLLLLLGSAVIIGISEAVRLNKTLKIMEAVGGSIYTGIVFFLQQNMASLLISSALAFIVGFGFLHRWLKRYDLVTGLTYTYALAALLLLTLGVAAVMALSLMAGGRWFRATGRTQKGEAWM
ncbi:darobactin export ABC transporter permease subunit [Sodalis ligni]|uniref:Putative ABC transport system permease protein n=1 Tax=Sodalis ligni TaxID=2697027 RepID=A0A4R1NGH0_9GAMM|nr:darobactin export ABC transporter permease subunit [Sodalis ligni]TCL06107.1 putative ABC transport system permease protein [Sodalis ligni]